MSDFTITLTLFLMIFCIVSSTPNCTIEKVFSTHPYKDPTLFYICLTHDKSWILKCPANTGFISTDELHGCVPWSLWPNAPEDRIPSCEDGQHRRLYRHVNPTLYFACKEIDTPIVVKCDKGKAFSYTKDLVGCVLWEEWKWENQINDD